MPGAFCVRRLCLKSFFISMCTSPRGEGGRSYDLKIKKAPFLAPDAGTKKDASCKINEWSAVADLKNNILIILYNVTKNKLIDSRLYNYLTGARAMRLERVAARFDMPCPVLGWLFQYFYRCLCFLHSGKPRPCPDRSGTVAAAN